MKIEEFLKLRPYDSIYNKESKSLEVIDAIDLVKKMVLIESGLYSFKDLKTREYYMENIFGEEITKHAEMDIIHNEINKLLDAYLSKESILALKELSNKKTEYKKDLNLI